MTKVHMIKKPYFYWLISLLTNGILFTLIFFILHLSTVYAQDKTITNKTYGFGLLIPSGYKQHQSPLPTVPVLISKDNEAYPELNIVIEARDSRSNLSRSPADWAKKIQEDYAMVGITKSKIEKSYLSDAFTVGKIPTTEITYTLGGINFKSIISRIETTSNILIVTYKDLAEVFDSRRSEFDRIVAGLTIEYVKNTAQNEISLLKFLGPILLLFVFWKLSKTRSKGSKLPS